MNRARKPLVCGNWKMNKGGLDGLNLASQIAESARAAALSGVDLVVAPPFTALAAVAAELDGTSIEVAAQNAHHEVEGAYTGEIAARMIESAGARWVIVGHSERREQARESSELVAKKATRVLEAGLTPIVCVGETLAERETGRALAVIGEQLAPLLAVLAKAPRACALAYEPVWAIGTGKTARPSDAEDVHRFVREELAKLGADVAARTRILYGGSVKPDNATSLLSQPNIDGALVGGASLDAQGFLAIARAAADVATNG